MPTNGNAIRYGCPEQAFVLLTPVSTLCNMVIGLNIWQQDVALAVIDDVVTLAIGRAFREARQSGRALDGFPGPIPLSLPESYMLQDQAIEQWPDDVIGWKVGRILGDLAIKYGTDRLIGPIFGHSLQFALGQEATAFEAIDGGFCAVEAEFVFELGRDAPMDRTALTDEEALDLVASVHIGIEIAGSPLATINDLGPCVVVSDFGNNAGLILGPEIQNWRGHLGDLGASVSIDGKQMGTGTVTAFPGGIERSLSFALNAAAKRGRPLKSGMLVSTGAVSGVHDIKAGQSAIADFGAHGTILCRCGA